MDGCMGRRMDAWIDRWMDDGWWRDGWWMNGQMEGCMDGR